MLADSVSRLSASAAASIFARSMTCPIARARRTCGTTRANRRRFVQRTEGQNGHIKRIMIVAVVRKLTIALWRYLEQGLVSQGATFTR
jgi:transposase